MKRNNYSRATDVNRDIHSSLEQSDHELQKEITSCRKCSRLVRWREEVALKKVKRFFEQNYWGKPVPSFGSILSRVLIVGLAPAAHGATRTGRMFTGDRSGEWLYEALFKYGFSTSPVSIHENDGLELRDCRITAVAHCAPPQNKLLHDEIIACQHFLKMEIDVMENLKVIVALGKVAFDTVKKIEPDSKTNRSYQFSHGVEALLANNIFLLASYHPSQQNTFTGKLTKKMFHQIFRRTKQFLS